MDKGFEVTPASGDTIEFTCTEEEAEEICGAMTKAAMKRELTPPCRATGCRF